MHDDKRAGPAGARGGAPAIDRQFIAGTRRLAVRLDLDPLKRDLCRRIVENLDGDSRTLAEISASTRLPASDLSRLRRFRIDAFKVERLLYVLHCLGCDLDIQVTSGGADPAITPGIHETKA